MNELVYSAGCMTAQDNTVVATVLPQSRAFKKNPAHFHFGMFVMWLFGEWGVKNKSNQPLAEP